MRDLTSTPLMLIKALLFLALALLCGSGLWTSAPHLMTVVLALVLGWSAARFYYFLFYVLHTYVEPSERYSGLIAIARAALERGPTSTRRRPS